MSRSRAFSLPTAWSHTAKAFLIMYTETMSVIGPPLVFTFCSILLSRASFAFTRSETLGLFVSSAQTWEGSWVGTKLALLLSDLKTWTVEVCFFFFDLLWSSFIFCVSSFISSSSFVSSAFSELILVKFLTMQVISLTSVSTSASFSTCLLVTLS